MPNLTTVALIVSEKSSTSLEGQTVNQKAGQTFLRNTIAILLETIKATVIKFGMKVVLRLA